MPDPFDTAALRSAVLDSWASSPTRFREDANAEEDLRLGGYADAWFVELAQNAADAGQGAGRLAVAIVDGELRVANTGDPLTAAGVAALASLRASAKRDDAGSVGRFGVGFAAVLTVSDAPRVISTSGGIAFSAARTAEAVAGLAGPAAELARRDEPPVLRLVWPTDEQPPAGFATEVRLPLRPGVDPAALLEHARATAADLLLALPGLVEIDVAGTVLRRTDGPAPGLVTIGDRVWLLARRTGTLADDVLDAAVEQRERRDWSVAWALPLTGDDEPAPLADDVAHAPTATLERLALPARLLATLPLEPDRRRVRKGPVTDQVLDAAAAAYLDLVAAVAPNYRLALVPEPGFPRSELDAQLHELVLTALRGAVWLPAAGGGELAPGRAEWLDLPGAEPALSAQLADAGFDRLVDTAGFDRLLAGPATVLGELGVHRLGATELVTRLFGIERPPSWWRTLYDAFSPLAETVPGLLDELRALPVPLADGRTAAGPATVLLPADPPAEAVAGIAALGLPGLHIADPAAVHPLLARLGAAPADPAELLGHPALAEAVERSVDEADAGLDQEPLATAVLGLVAEVGGGPRAELGALALPASDGRPTRADELLLPDAALRPLLADDVPLDVLDAGWAERVPRSALVAAGVLDGFALVVDEDPVRPDHDLDDEERWWDGLDEPPVRLVAVRDLDLVDDDAWPAALALLAGDRATREAVMARGSYTAWWLARHARLGGRRPGHWRLASAATIAALYDAVPGDPAVDEAFLTAVGVRAQLRIDDNRAADDLLDRLADPQRRPDAALVSDAHEELSEAVAAGRVRADDLALPERVRALDGSVVDVDVAVVLDAPWLAAVLPPGELVIGGDPAALAELLDLPLAGEVVAATVEGTGTAVRWSALAEVVVACHTFGVPVPDGELELHDELWITLARPTNQRTRVPAWPDATGRWHAEDPLRALLGLLA
ncbi:sacsin N-terminal ATP-binding-like domain-containing protein [Pseudonocardia sp. GCM10023141]|uniref:sacsin N-terminal ATP-binding-like domain-containing protein n=1 Tax=Pseudonocardia sp. GCM10023141 TaxID=3252653 RepID=UPI00361C859A